MSLFLFRHSHLSDGTPTVRMGQRTIAQKYGRGPKMSTPSRQHVIKQLQALEEKGCIRSGDTNREGTLYTVYLPLEIPFVIEKLAAPEVEDNEDYFNNQEKRQEIYERDQFVCQYCGEKTTPENITLDHFIPQSKGGSHKKENLRTACLLCNSIKSGKTYEEAAIPLLKSIQERREKRATA